MWKLEYHKRNSEKKGNIPILLLFLFFLTAAGMTVISQKNYERNLLLVSVMQPEKKSLQYIEEYLAVYNETQEGILVQWEMGENAEYAKDGEVWIYPVYIENRVTETGKLVPYYIKKEGYQGQWIHSKKNSDSDLYTMETGLEIKLETDLDKWSEAEQIMVELHYTGIQRESVIPCSAILSPSLPTESPRIYVIEEIPKIWGTATQLQTVPVMILESNGIEAAIGNTILADFVIDVKQSDLYEGVPVKPVIPVESEVLEEGGKENEEEK